MRDGTDLMTTTPCVGWGVPRAHRGQSEVSSAVNMADSLTEPVCLKDFESYARQYLPNHAFEFFAGGANEETTIRENLEAFKRCENMGREHLGPGVKYRSCPHSTGQDYQLVTAPPINKPHSFPSI